MEVFSFQIYYVPFRFQWMNHFQRKLVKRHIFYIFDPFLVSITFLQWLVLFEPTPPGWASAYHRVWENLGGEILRVWPHLLTYLTWDCEEQGVLKWGQRNDQGRGVWYKPIFFLFVLLAGFPNLLKNSPRGWENQRPSEYSSSSRDLNWDKSQDTRLRYRDNTPCSNISWSLTRSM